MKKINISGLNKYNYSADIFNSLDYPRKNKEVFSCINKPKKVNILVYLKNCSAVYTQKNGDVFTAECDDVVYTPAGSEYSSEFTLSAKHGSTLGFNFSLYDNKFNPFILDDGIIIFKNQRPEIKQLFSALNSCYSPIVPNICMAKSHFYEIMSLLCESSQKKRFGKYDVISVGIRYLESHDNPEVCIRDLADMCNVSECYFRRLFKEFSGMTPVEYITRNKIKKAKNYLKYENISVGNIAQLLGFSDASYFTKQFKNATGITPAQYRKKF